MGRKRWIVVAMCIAVLTAGCGRSDDSSEGDDGSTTTTVSTAQPASGDFGSLTDVCQPGDATGATATGVTDDEIRIATFSDAGFSGRPGLNQEFFDTAEVFSKWCNDAGGINGRKIVVDEHDAALTEVQAEGARVLRAGLPHGRWRRGLRRHRGRGSPASASSPTSRVTW